MEELSSNRKRVRDELEDSRFDSPEVKRIKEDLLENFDDTEFFTGSHELDSFMKSFEEEISSAGSTVAEESAAATVAASAVVVDLASESWDSRPELGYLLEASDDELGIPPSMSDVEKDELTRVASDSAELSDELWKYDEGIPNFDSFEYGIGDGGSYYNNNIGGAGGSEYVALDGLFDYSDGGFGSSDYLWRPETLPAN